VIAVDIDYPLRFDGRGRTADTGRDDHLGDMIEQLLFTNPGERVNRPDFGSGLLELVFAPNSPELAAALQFSMQAALQRWLGDLIDIEGLTVQSDDGTLRVELRYVSKQTGTRRSDIFERPGLP
jgi:phage baseplate assembly protein W